MNISFPKHFWWGSAASATQTEGTQNIDDQTNWDYWYQQEPNRFFDQVGPGVTSNFYYTYKDDIQLMKATGHNSFRLSISWTRLINQETGDVNEAAVDFYNKVIDELISNDIEPFVNLYHFDMPLKQQEQGGFESKVVVKHYLDYAQTCFELFGDRVTKWFTFNEPIVPVEGGYFYNFHYPDVNDAKRGIQFAFHTILANAKVIELFKSRGYQGEIGIILNLTPSYPRSNNHADVRAAEIADLFFNRSFLDPVTKGEFPSGLIEILEQHDLLPEYEAKDLQVIKQNTIDLLGVNYYQPRRIKAKDNLPNPNAPFKPEYYFDNYEMPGRKMNPYRGWEIYPKGIYDIMINLKQNYSNIKSFISENGMGVENEQRFLKDGRIEDDYRIRFLQDHLYWLHRALDEGANCHGYHMWTFMDNWSWMNAYKNRYGFISVDLENQKRTIKKSGYWFKALAETNQFDYQV
ncbi:glycoside hydrolase family 1 protein [Staphylococcus gallinarum]|uniref:glycoside hydrolase family 1 protein n=1 Tax=Staphylococcus gallinarum TaxID=1293 RepID=UPI000D1D0A74|nr:glycoside hydrolase family 1 protein [Staphylococcus gallinarum]MBU7218112.1 glycoside hydrolase family 1 protein [Staphylococcus gallinarum]MCD8793923.1 glycoside hydrolase family 1 protein [Staphylococcus gallinarum]PTE35865.1 6-phospho-beta-glucosidase [Staphylococcus gallinarum]PTK90420.1 6-phospho-beta-glucosidase [Staphylococcus gallinarum]RIL20216.1 glycoside hydrolase family 1 protein [Staphylococcus gallinarum]